MRGKLGKENTVFGDVIYDWAKLYQSLIGYDEIQENIELDFEYKKELILVFERHVTHLFKEYPSCVMRDIKTITKSLLFSLLPLHSDKSKCERYYQLMNNL